MMMMMKLQYHQEKQRARVKKEAYNMHCHTVGEVLNKYV